MKKRKHLYFKYKNNHSKQVIYQHKTTSFFQSQILDQNQLPKALSSLFHGTCKGTYSCQGKKLIFQASIRFCNQFIYSFMSGAAVVELLSLFVYGMQTYPIRSTPTEAHRIYHCNDYEPHASANAGVM